MKALFGRTKKDAALQGGAGGAAAGPPAPDGGSRRPGPAVPFLHKSKAEPSPAAARPELAALQGPAGSAPGATGHLSRASGEIEPAENTTLAHGIAGPASGASMAKLNLENTGLREATAESTVGAGRLFARPTVCGSSAPVFRSFSPWLSRNMFQVLARNSFANREGKIQVS
jgi:hypothetical protein